MFQKAVDKSIVLLCGWMFLKEKQKKESEKKKENWSYIMSVYSRDCSTLKTERDRSENTQFDTVLSQNQIKSSLYNHSTLLLSL